MKKSACFLVIVLLGICPFKLFAQDVILQEKDIAGNDSSFVKINAINVTGAKRTKTYIILREMQFKTGDTIRKSNLAANFSQARNQIYNTSLFTEVKLDSVYLDSNSIVVNVHVRERWYIYPTPEFQITDRSYNEWIKVYNANLNRVVYGVKFVHNNFSGRNDKLRIFLLNGYARNIAIRYSNPYSNTRLNQGFGFSAGFTQNREINYKTTYQNKLLQYKIPGFVRNGFGVSAFISNRNGFFKSHSFSASLNYLIVSDSVITKYNPSYFNDSSRYQFYPAIGYNFAYVNTNNNNYPQKGEVYTLGISKTGTKFTGGINNFTIAAGYSKFITHPHHFFSAIQTSGFVKLPFNQAYINRRAMGFGNFYLRGLENYVIDGVAAGIAKYSFSKKVLAFNIPVPFHIKALPNIPFKIFAKVYADAGYSYINNEFTSNLNNRMLYSSGFGLDILTFYDINIKLEYSFNQLGQNGLFLHGRGGF